MDVLPRECLDYIVSLLDVESLASLSITDHYVRDFVQSPRYWQFVDLSKNTRTDIFLKYLANCYGNVVKLINLKDVQSQKKDIKNHINNFSCLERIICDQEDREINEHVVINRMVKTAQKMLKAIQEDNQSNHSALWKDLQVRQARVLLWDALWIALANKHGVKFVLKSEKHFQNIYHDAHLSTSIISLLLDTERLMCKPDLELFPKSIVLPKKIEMMTFITDPRSNNTYLAIGIEYRILLWDVQLRQFVKTFHTVLTKTTEPLRLRNLDQWAGIVVNFEREEQPILIAATSGRYYCWHFDTSSLIYERKLNGEYEAKTQILLAKNESFSTVLLIHENSCGCLVADPYTGQFINELPRVSKYKAYTCLTNDGKFITIKKSKEKDGTLTVKIKNIFTEKQELVQKIDGDFKSRDAQEKCHTFGDELIAVSGSLGYALKIYRRFVDKTNGDEYKLIQSIEMNHSADLIRFLSKDVVATRDDIFDINTGQRMCSIKIDPYTLEHYPIAFNEQTKLFAKASERRVALLCDITSGQNQLEDSHPRTVPNKFTRSRDTLLFHEKYLLFDEKDISSYITLKITCNESGSNNLNQLPYNIEYVRTFKEEGMLIDVTQDKYGLISERKNTPQQETFKVIDMDTKTVIWQHVVKSRQVKDRYGELNDEDTTGALLVPQSDHVIVQIPGGGLMLFDWKENRPIIELENRKFQRPLKLSPSGRYYAMETSVRYTRTLVYNRIEKSLVLLDFAGNSEAIDFNPSNEDQLAYAGCGVKIVDLKKKIQIKELTRFIDGQVEVLRESESITFVKYSPSGKYLAVIEKPSRKPWGLNIAPCILRVYETEKWTMITCLDLGNGMDALYWLDDEHALIGSTDGKINQMRIVVPEFAHLFKYIIPPNQGGEIAVKDVSSYLIDDDPDSASDLDLDLDLFD